ncbi:hypothetical protein ABPG72_008460 [Tetrahymena utriculariae]
MSSSTCERFVFDVCSANPNTCKICKNNKSMHADCAPVKRDFKFGVQVQANDTLNHYNSLSNKIEKKTPFNQQDDKKQESQESSKQKISQQPAPAIVTSAKPNDNPKSPQVLRNKVVQQPTSSESDLSRKNQVQQLVRGKEDKIKQNCINQYVSTPNRGSQAYNTPSQRPRVASACQSSCSGDSPNSQKSLPSSNFSTATQKLQDQQDTKQQQQDENSNQFPSNEQAKINENPQSEQKITHDETNQINQEKNNPPTQKDQLNQNLQSAEQQNQKQVQQDSLDLKLKQERERQEQQKIEKEKLATLLQKQSQEAYLRNEDKSKPVQSNKGLTLAEILARQKQKIEQEDGNKNIITVGPQQNQIQQTPKNNLPSTINNELNSIQKQIALKEGLQTTVQQKSDQVNNQISSQDKEKTQKNTMSNQNQVEKDNLQKKPVNQDGNQKINSNDIIKPEEKKEQKPLGTVAQRIQELQKQQQQQHTQQSYIKPNQLDVQFLQEKKGIYQNQKVNLNQKVGLNSQSDNQKLETQKELQPKSDILFQAKPERSPEIIAQQIEINNETSEKQIKQEQDLKVTQEIKKPTSLIQQQKNQIGNLSFGVQPQISQNRQFSNQSEEVQQNDCLNIPFVKEQNSDFRDSQKDLLDRPVMKKNVRSSRKMNLNELKDENE